MRKRFKRLKRKVYTYDQLCKKIAAWKRRPEVKADRNGPPPVLYGGLHVRYIAVPNHLVLQWRGSLARAGGPRETITIEVAAIQRSVGESTLYRVFGLPPGESNSPRYTAALKVWRRYVNAFTPHDATQKVQGWAATYLVKDGTWSPAGPSTGAWASQPSFMCLKMSEWIKGWDECDAFAGLPKFKSRSKRFVRDLRMRLSECGLAEVQLVRPMGAYDPRSPHISVAVCTPPRGSTDGTRLEISMAVHSKESTEYHRVSREYGQRHSQYWVHNKSLGRQDRYKCGRDALNAIIETVLGSIYIPGPE
jgi:hypothetical protein